MVGRQRARLDRLRLNMKNVRACCSRPGRSKSIKLISQYSLGVRFVISNIETAADWMPMDTKIGSKKASERCNFNFSPFFPFIPPLFPPSRPWNFNFSSCIPPVGGKAIFQTLTMFDFALPVGRRRSCHA